MAVQLPATITDTYKKLTEIKIVVNSQETRVSISKHLQNVVAFIKSHKSGVKLLKAPFQAAIKDIDERAKPILEKAEEMEEQCKGAILAFDEKERLRIQKENEKKLVKYEGKVATKEAEAVLAGKEAPFVAPPALKPEPAKTVVVGGGTQTTVVTKKWWMPEVPKPMNEFSQFNGDPSEEFKGYTMLQNQGKEVQIPSEYFVLDVATIGRVIRAGGTIPGIEVVEVRGLANRGL